MKSAAGLTALTAVALAIAAGLPTAASGQSGPAPPSSITVHAADEALTVTWQAPSGVTGITAYDLRVKPTSSSFWITIDPFWIGGSLVGYLPNATNGVSYDIRMRTVTSRTGPWSATVSKTPADPGGTPATAAYLPLGVELRGKTSAGDTDVYKFQVATTGHVWLPAYSTSVDLDGSLVDAQGQTVTANVFDLEGGIGGFVLADRLSSGTHYLKVTRSGGAGSGSYRIRALTDRGMEAIRAACSPSAPYDDLLSGCQWHLRNSTSSAEDLDVDDVWTGGNKGAGIGVAVVDTGVHLDHPDLVDNVDKRRSHDYTGRGQTDMTKPGPDHGTAVAGIIAARDNSLGGRGVAPRATIYSYNFLLHQTALSQTNAMTRNMATTGVHNNSYGFEDGPGLNATSIWWEFAVNRGTINGYGGKGVLYVKAAGNGHAKNDNSNFDEASNYHRVVAVCAITDTGARAGYSEHGANLWVCGPSNGGSAGIFTTILHGRYTRSFGGTSAAAPMVSGVAALVRAANVHLNWRDVRMILAASARKNDSTNGGWLAGAAKYGASGNYEFNHEYGFGAVDAKAAVDLADGWTNLPAYVNTSQSKTVNLRVPDSPANAVTTTVTIDDAGIDFVEFVEIFTDFTAPSFRDLRVELVSPSNRVSTLAVPASLSSSYAIPAHYRFGSARHLGEDPNGTWTLRIKDEVSGGSAATLESWQLKIHGHKTCSNCGSGTAGVTISTTRLSVDENGGTATYTAVLDAQPSGNVTITPSSSATDNATVWPASLAFTPSNWNSAQTVFVTGVDDSIVNDSLRTATISHRASGGGYDSVTIPRVAVSVTDDDDTSLVGKNFSVVAASSGDTFLDLGSTGSYDTDSEVVTPAAIRVVTLPASGRLVKIGRFDWQRSGTRKVVGVVAAGDVVINGAPFGLRSRTATFLVYEPPAGGLQSNTSFTWKMRNAKGEESVNTWTATIRTTNAAPTLSVGSIPDQTLTMPGESAVVHLSDHFSDPDADDALTWKATQVDSRIVTASISGSTLTLTPRGGGILGDDANEGGGIKVTATDSGGKSVSGAFKVWVIELPVIADRTWNRGEAISVALPDPDGLKGRDVGYYRYRARFAGSLPAGLAAGRTGHSPLNGGCGAAIAHQRDICGTVSPSADLGTYDVTYSVQQVTPADFVLQTVSRKFTITVKQPPTSPTVSAAFPDRVLILPGSAATFDVSGHFADADGDTLTYGVSHPANDVVSAAITGSALTLVPKGGGVFGDDGNENGGVTVTATDDDGNSVSDVFVVRVLALAKPADLLYRVGVAASGHSPPSPTGTASGMAYRHLLQDADGAALSSLGGLAWSTDSGDPGFADGTPNAAAARAAYRYTVTEASSAAPTTVLRRVTQNFTIEIKGVLSVSPADQSHTVGIGVLAGLPAAEHAAGSVTYSVSSSPALSDFGLQFDVGNPTSGPTCATSSHERRPRHLCGTPTKPTPAAGITVTYRAADAGGGGLPATNATATFQLKIAPADLATARVPNQLYAKGKNIRVYTFPQPSGGMPPYSFELLDENGAAAKLPDHLSFRQPSDGGTLPYLRGVPVAELAPLTVTYKVSDGAQAAGYSANGTAARTFTIEVVGPPVLPQPANMTYAVGQTLPTPPLTLPAATAGGTGIAYSLRCASPADWLSMNAARQLSGTAPGEVHAAGTCTYKAKNKLNEETTTTFTVAVETNATPTISGTQPDVTYTAGQAVKLLLPAATSGAEAVTYALTSSNASAHPNLSFDAGTRTLSGTAPSSAANWTYTYKATDGSGDEATQTFTVTVEADSSPSFGSATIENREYRQNAAIDSVTLPSASGGNGTAAYALRGPSRTLGSGTVVHEALPRGLSFDAATRTLSGTPSLLQAAKTYAYTATDRDGDVATLTMTIAVLKARNPSFGSKTVADRSYAKDAAIANLVLPEVTVADRQPVTYRLTPTTLPAGLSFGADGGGTTRCGTGANAARTLCGTPTAAQSATAYIWLARDSAGATAFLIFTIAVTEPAPADPSPSFGSKTISNQTWKTGKAKSIVRLPAATGGKGSVTYSLTPALPAGLRLNTPARYLFGAPTAAQAATTYTWKATDRGGAAAQLTFTIEVVQNLVPRFSGTILSKSYARNQEIVPETLPLASGGNGTITYTLHKKPAWMSFNSSTRAITGTPTTLQPNPTWALWEARDEDGDTDAIQFAVEVTETDSAPSFAGVTIPAKSYMHGQPVRDVLPAATGGNAALLYTIGDLPAGLTLDPATRTLAGAPTTGQSATNHAYTVTDADGDTATATLSIAITGSVTVSTGSVSVSENGGTATYTVVLGTQPSGNVTITPSSDDTGSATTSGALTFSASNWNVGQTVTVTGVDDSTVNGSARSATISHSASGGDYGSVAISSVSVSVTDDDATATVSESALQVAENAGTGTYTVKLDAAPTADVTVTAASGTPANATVSPVSLTFNTTNFGAAQTVTVTGVDDSLVNGTARASTISHSASGGGYGGNLGDVTVTLIDDERPGVTVSTSGVSVAENGGTATWTVALTTQPSSNVTVTATSDPTAHATVSPASLTFATTNFGTAQTITVTGVDDDVANASARTATVSHSASGGGYERVTIASVTVTLTDDDDTVTAPGAVTGLAATAGDGQVALSWTAPATGGTATGYEVCWKTGTDNCDADNASDWTDTGTAGTTHPATGLVNGTQYKFQVRATNSAGRGPASNVANATPAAAQTVPGAPTNLTAAAGNTEATLSWEAPASGGAVSSYEVRSKTTGDYGGWNPAGSRASFVVTGLVNDTAYTFQVRAKNSVGEGAASNEAEATPTTSDTLPMTLTVTPGDGSATLSWTAPPGGTENVLGWQYWYNVSDDVGGAVDLRIREWNDIPESVPTTTSHVVSGLDNEQPYEFRVRAAYKDGTYGVSPMANATPAASGGGGGPGGGGGGPGGGGGGGGDDDDDDDEDDGDTGGGGGGGGPPKAEIAVDAECTPTLCRARTGVPVNFQDTGGSAFVSRRWEFGDGAQSRNPTARHAWASPGFYEVTLRVAGGDVESVASRIFLVEAAEPAGTCTATDNVRCLQDSRFQVAVDVWTVASGGEATPATIVPAGTNDSGLFWFFDPDNWEMIVKVLDGCAVNGAVWVMAAATTDQGYAIRVTDTATGTFEEYRNEPGTPAKALLDTAAFPDSCRP